MIIYENTEDNCVGILHPMADCPLPVEAIARKDVPAGAPYRIVPDDFFADQIEAGVERQDWAADFSQPDGYGDNRYGAGTPWEVTGYAVNSEEMLQFETRNVETQETDLVNA